MIYMYQSAGGHLEKDTSNHGAEQLGSPVILEPEQVYVATNIRSERHCRVDMPAGNVDRDGDRHKECKGMGERGSDEAGLGFCIALSQLVYNQQLKHMKSASVNDIIKLSSFSTEICRRFWDMILNYDS